MFNRFSDSIADSGLMNIVDTEMLKKYLRILVLLFLQIFGLLRLQKLKCKELNFLQKLISINLETSGKELNFVHI